MWCSGTISRSNGSARNRPSAWSSRGDGTIVVKPKRLSASATMSGEPAESATTIARRCVILARLRFRDRWKPILYRAARRKRRVRNDRQRIHGPRVHRGYHHWSDDDQQLRLVVLPLRAREELAQDRNVLQEGDSGLHEIARIVEQAGDDQALVSPHIDSGRHASRLECRDAESRQSDRVVVVDARDFRRERQLDETVVQNLGHELELHTELLKHYRDRVGAAGGLASLHDRNRNLAASEERRGVTIRGKHVRLRKRPGKTLLLVRIQQREQSLGVEVGQHGQEPGGSWKGDRPVRVERVVRVERAGPDALVALGVAISR